MSLVSMDSVIVPSGSIANLSEKVESATKLIGDRVIHELPVLSNIESIDTEFAVTETLN